MKILIDINHPAHVHYFRNFITDVQKRGNTCIITNRDSTLINGLLDEYGIQHIIRSSRPKKNSFLTSLYYLFKMVRAINKVSRKYDVDFYLGFASAPCSIVSFLRKKPCVVLDDTEHNKLNQFLYSKFCDTIITPFYFEKNLGIKQIRINAFIEQLYLHSGFFETKKSPESSKYILIRFIAFDARHDSKVSNKLTVEDKIELVERLIKNNHRVFISIEGENKVDFFKPYLLKSNITDIHHVIANADFFISEGATMACEAGVVGTPYFYSNPLRVGYINYQCETYNHAYQGTKEGLFKIIDKLPATISKNENKKKIEEFTINPTPFLVWFILNYPKSRQIINTQVVDKEFIKENLVN